MPAVMMLSREVRRVPLDFQHPTKRRYDVRTGSYVEDHQPVFDRFYVPAVREWLAGWEAWQTSPHPRADGRTFEEWDGNGPDPDYYYPGAAWPEGAEMGICMYETVTEGTPISAVYPDTPKGRADMAAELARTDTSITSSLTAADWLEVIEASAVAPMGTDLHSGQPVRG
jgi:hypothetical protein